MKGARILLSLLTAALLFIGLLWISAVNPMTVWDLIKTCNLSWLGAAFAAYTASYLGRALRFKILLRGNA
ncbi:MAG: hypothetical protein KJ645_03265, partial [Planctomycetes bacterium]|nr:hypothetical protein [Planctomycetota bacterium]